MRLNSLRLVFLGAPGSGKGTQTAFLQKQYESLKAISSGDIIRKELEAMTPAGKIAKTYVSNGSLVPDELIMSMILSDMKKINCLNPSSSWILDGFPRTSKQANMLQLELKKVGAQLNLVIELDVPQHIILDRITHRYVHIPSGRTYNLHYNPPKVAGKDDITGEPLTKRVDDKEIILRKRLNDYNSSLASLKEFYQREGVLHTVRGESSDAIFPKILKIIQCQNQT